MLALIEPVPDHCSLFTIKQLPGASCLKLTMSLVNVSLNFQT